MKAWTTLEQRAWLETLLPQWRKQRSHKSSGFLDTTTARFLELFPGCEHDRRKLRSVSTVPTCFLHFTATHSVIEASTMVPQPFEGARVNKVYPRVH